MASSLGPSAPWPVGSIALLIGAFCLYALLLIPLVDAARSLPPMSGEGRYSAAWSQMFALVFGGLLWIVLGILLWIGGHRGEMPNWAAVAIGALYLLSGLAGGFAIDRIYQFPGGGWCWCRSCCRRWWRSLRSGRACPPSTQHCLRTRPAPS